MQWFHDVSNAVNDVNAIKQMPLVSIRKLIKSNDLKKKLFKKEHGRPWVHSLPAKENTAYMPKISA